MSKLTTFAVLLLLFIVLIVGGRDAKAEPEANPYKVVVATVDYRGESKKVMYIGGPILEGISKDVRELLEAHPDVEAVMLSSAGGYANEGYELAQIMSDNRLQTIVLRGRYCLSACAIAFMGGDNYVIEGVLGFHNAWRPTAAVITDEEAKVGFNTAQIIGAYWLRFVLLNGYSHDFAFDVLHKTDPNTFLIFTDEADFNTYKVTDRNNMSEYYEVASEAGVALESEVFFPAIVGPQISEERAFPTLTNIVVIEERVSTPAETGNNDGDSAS